MVHFLSKIKPDFKRENSFRVQIQVTSTRGTTVPRAIMCVLRDATKPYIAFLKFSESSQEMKVLWVIFWPSETKKTPITLTLVVSNIFSCHPYLGKWFTQCEMLEIGHRRWLQVSYAQDVIMMYIYIYRYYIDIHAHIYIHLCRHGCVTSISIFILIFISIVEFIYIHIYCWGFTFYHETHHHSAGIFI